ncbi:regulatory LuxR family protein [Kribbella sp. VKM Ac-2527]|uniref:Regulatory LuxR family protein n=1 Tax=Kribbella caucasensis TaxID=2512215 RepID=A0A4V3C5P8_9ACTN|nr:LuxR C-terminal-related transcriptional regulator [Kribbella sp. VKM Ac-2527]TDO30708.1 regulatory LuxR family protein [Kribbella sp. VKM Ac-2527]
MTALHNETAPQPNVLPRHGEVVPLRPGGGPRSGNVGLQREIGHDDLQLLRLLATGLPMDGVARRLGLSERTVRRRTRAACDRLGFGTAIEAIVWAAHRGLL